jgi:hypothetical protein
MRFNGTAAVINVAGAPSIFVKGRKASRGAAINTSRDQIANGRIPDSRWRIDYRESRVNRPRLRLATRKSRSPHQDIDSCFLPLSPSPRGSLPSSPSSSSSSSSPQSPPPSSSASFHRPAIKPNEREVGRLGLFLLPHFLLDGAIFIGIFNGK